MQAQKIQAKHACALATCCLSSLDLCGLELHFEIIFIIFKMSDFIYFLYYYIGERMKMKRELGIVQIFADSHVGQKSICQIF